MKTSSRISETAISTAPSARPKTPGWWRRAWLLFGLLVVTVSARGQDASFTVAVNANGSDNYVDIRNTSGSGGRWYFFSDPAPSAARMSRVSSSGISETPWGAANFRPDRPACSRTASSTASFSGFIRRRSEAER